MCLHGIAPSLTGVLKSTNLDTRETDIDLWDTFINGDIDSLTELFRLHYSYLINYGVKITTDREMVEDCIQELFVEIWENKNATPTISVRSYLLTALKYKLLKLLKKQNRASTNNVIWEKMNFEISHDTFLVEKMQTEERIIKVLDALDHLSNKQKEMVYLKFFRNLSYEEISGIMKINYQVARNLLYHAVKALKGRLEGSYSY